MTDHALAFVRDADGVRLELDGHDITDAVIGIELGAYAPVVDTPTTLNGEHGATFAGALGRPGVTLVLRVDRLQLETRADVHIDATTAQALTRLRWTPPKDAS